MIWSFISWEPEELEKIMNGKDIYPVRGILLIKFQSSLGRISLNKDKRDKSVTHPGTKT